MSGVEGTLTTAQTDDSTKQRHVIPLRVMDSEMLDTVTDVMRYCRMNVRFLWATGRLEF
jgi:hypothetical protein